LHTVLKAYAHLRELSKVEMRRGRGGVVVRDTLDIEKVARQLVSVARTQGLSKVEVGELIEEVWA
jgi:DNA-binding transcriptional regulator YhcF (GntR family)